jgi:hypothetical protein
MVRQAPDTGYGLGSPVDRILDSLSDLKAAEMLWLAQFHMPGTTR